MNDAVNISLVPSKVFQAMIVADAVNDSLMIWGAPGIGKSDSARQYANLMYPLRKDNIGRLAELKLRVQNPNDTFSQADYDRFDSKLIDQESNFIDFRLSQIEPTDLRGIPVPVKRYMDEDGQIRYMHELVDGKSYKEESTVVWAAPEQLKLPLDWRGVIMFDEINSAMPIVQAASYQLILDRRIGELELPKGAFILAAGNRDTDGGVTFSLATPLRDRMTHVTMEPDLNDWTDNWAIKNRVHPRVISYLKNAGQHFNTLNKTDPSQSGGSSPRSWVRVSDFEYFRDENKSIDRDVFKAMLAGRISDGIALQYLTFCENVHDLPDTMSILEGTTELLPSELDTSQNYFVALNLVYKIIDLNLGKIKGTLSVKEWGRMCSNFLRFIDKNFGEENPELVILSIRTLTQHDCDIMFTEVPYFKEFVDTYRELVQRARKI